MATDNLSHVVTGEARLSYVNILRPAKKRNATDREMYKLTVLVPKSDTATMGRINAAIEAAIQRGATEKWGGRPPQVALPVYDGDGVRPSDGTPFGPECKGHWVMTASSSYKPEIVDANRNPILNESEIYSGIFGRVSVDFFPYGGTREVPKKGVGCALGNVQKLRDGVPLAGGSTAEEDFGGATAGYPAPQQPVYTPLSQGAYAAPAAQPGYPPAYAPAQAVQQGYPPAYAQVQPAQPPAYAPAAYPGQGPAINPITGLPM